MSYIVPQSQEEKIASDPKISLKYQILQKLGSGCFGTVYKALNRISKKQVALKIEHNTSQKESAHSKKSNLVNEIVILERLKGITGVPKIYSAGRWSRGYYMEIELFTSSLSDEKERQFTKGEIHGLASELIGILREIHGRGVVHQDLKPQNIMRNAQGALVIIDFGLSCIFQPSEGTSEGQSRKRGFVGTPRYAPLAAHYGNPQTGKDDIESMMYVLGTLYLKKAPWFQLKGPENKKLEKIQKYKELHNESWFKNCGESFLSVYQYLKLLQPGEAVDYTYLQTQLQSQRRKLGMKTQKFRQAPFQAAYRRKSDCNYDQMVPIINIHLVQSKGKKKPGENAQGGKRASIKEVRTLTFSESKSSVSNSHNFSQKAQDGYIELIQMLTEKIFRSFEDQDKENFNSKLMSIKDESAFESGANFGKGVDEIEADDSAGIKTSLCREPVINKLQKYEGLHFKNPFSL